MADTFLISNTDGTVKLVEIIDRFMMHTVAGMQEFATHRNTGHELDGLKKITHYRTGMCLTLMPIKADVTQCRLELERTLGMHTRAKIVQRFAEPATLNPAAPEVPTHQPPKEDDMSLEDAIIKNTAAVAELTAALLQHIANNPGKAAAAPADAAPAKEKTAPKAKKEEAAPKVEEKKAEEPAALNLETDIKPRAVEVATAKGRDTLVALLQRLGCTVGKTSELKLEQYAEFMDLAAKTITGEYDPMAGLTDDV